MTYDELTRYLFGLRRFGIRLGLENVQRLLEELGNPHTKFPSIHIAGTNGKGSTGAFIECIWRLAGYRTGLYTSPHLLDFRERICVDQEKIPLSRVVELLDRLRGLIERYSCTFFEVMTAISFAYFAEKGVDLAVVETGLGGRLDATNVIHPLLTIITEIDLDHTLYLGDTVEKVAYEKAGIIKPGVDLITTATSDVALKVFQEICQARGSRLLPIDHYCELDGVQVTDRYSCFNLRTRLRHYPDLILSLLGRHQIRNATAAILAAEILQERYPRITPRVIADALRQTFWPGRLQVLRWKPTVVLDAAHNPNGIQILVQAVREIFRYRRCWVVMGVLRDKDYEGMLQEIAPMAHYFLAVTPNSDRALPSKTLAEVAARYLSPFGHYSNPVEGYQEALRRAHPEDLICITGSNYTISEILKLFADGSEFTPSAGLSG